MAAVPSIVEEPAALATRDLYERYGAQIQAFCLHRLGNREEAEDATQSTFLNALRGLQRGVAPEFESAWLYKIAHNVCLTRRRSFSRRRRVERPGDLDALQDLIPAPERERVEELLPLREALEQMPEQQRRALLLREWQGLSYKEIAAELELSQSAVETLLFRARRSFARGLEEKPARRGFASGGSGLVAVLKLLLVSGGSKVAATVVTVAATSLIASAPAARHDLGRLLAADPRVEPAHATVKHAAKATTKPAPVVHATVPAPAPVVVAPAPPRVVAVVHRVVHHAARIVPRPHPVREVEHEHTRAKPVERHLAPAPEADTPEPPAVVPPSPPEDNGGEATAVVPPAEPVATATDTLPQPVADDQAQSDHGHDGQVHGIQDAPPPGQDNAHGQQGHDEHGNQGNQGH